MKIIAAASASRCSARRSPHTIRRSCSTWRRHRRSKAPSSSSRGQPAQLDSARRADAERHQRWGVEMGSPNSMVKSRLEVEHRQGRRQGDGRRAPAQERRAGGIFMSITLPDGRKLGGRAARELLPVVSAFRRTPVRRDGEAVRGLPSRTRRQSVSARSSDGPRDD